MQLVVVAVRKRILRQIQTPIPAPDIHKLVLRPTLKARAVRHQPRPRRLRQILHHAPAAPARRIHSTMQPQPLVQIRIRIKTPVPAAQTRRLGLKTLPPLLQKAAVVGKLSIVQRIQ